VDQSRLDLKQLTEITIEGVLLVGWKWKKGWLWSSMITVEEMLTQL
jgi:hypothetical protein